MKRIIFKKTVREIGLPTALFVSEAIVATFIDRSTTLLHHIGIPDITLTLIGSAIGVVLAFRINSAYARWWEARILWGSIVNHSRSIARQALAGSLLSRQAMDFASRIIELHIAYVRLFCAQLHERDTTSMVRENYRGLISPLAESQENRAAFVQTEMAIEIRRGLDAGLFDSLQAARMDMTLSELANAQGGCERIKNTPLPPQLTVLTDAFVYLYALLLPFALADSLGLILPLVTGVITFTFLALSNVGRNLEHPFAGRFYDVSILTITNGIESVLRKELDSMRGLIFDSPEREIHSLREVAVKS